MVKKQLHCTPTCPIPNSPAAHEKVLFTLQQRTSARLVGNNMIFAIAEVPEVVPRRTNQGERPSEDRRIMMRACCGR